MMTTRIPLQTPNVGSPRSSNATSVPQRRVFGMRNVIDDDDEPSGLERSTRRASGGQNFRRQSFVSRWKRSPDLEDAIKSPMSERPPIPNALRGSESASTPLPILSMTVLSIVSFRTNLSDVTDKASRPCLGSFCLPTSPCHFCFSWSKVRNRMWCG